MAIYHLSEPDALRTASGTDLIALRPAAGSMVPICVAKVTLLHLADAMLAGEAIHLSGPTGSAKTSLIEALEVRANFEDICRHLGHRPLPLRLFPVEMCTFESPAELYHRRAIRQGETFDEASALVCALRAAAEVEDAYPLVWLREMGRVHAASVQGALLNIVTEHEVVLPDGERISTRGFGFIADSNYAAEEDHDTQYVLVALDAALKRRFSVNVKLDYLDQPAEAAVLHEICRVDASLRGVEADLVEKVTALGALIRSERAQGNLLSLTPPTIAGYTAFVRRVGRVPGHALRSAAFTTLLGNPSREDEKHALGAFNQIFAPGGGAEEGFVLDENLF